MKCACLLVVPIPWGTLGICEGSGPDSRELEVFHSRIVAKIQPHGLAAKRETAKYRVWQKGSGETVGGNTDRRWSDAEAEGAGYGSSETILANGT